MTSRRSGTAKSAIEMGSSPEVGGNGDLLLRMEPVLLEKPQERQFQR
jgi:hypothetical protein